MTDIVKLSKQLLPIAVAQAIFVAIVTGFSTWIFPGQGSIASSDFIVFELSGLVVVYGLVILLASLADRQTAKWSLGLLLLVEAGITLAALASLGQFRTWLDLIFLIWSALPVLPAGTMVALCLVRLREKPAKVKRSAGRAKRRSRRG